MNRLERRRSARRPCRFRVRFRTPRELKEHFITNIGEGGVFVETYYPLRIGAPVDLELVVGEDPRPLAILGEVTWIRGPDEDGAPGMGIRFVAVSAPVRSRLGSILQGAP
jgi:uncharacterized protein (TIGR02266 family)